MPGRLLLAATDQPTWQIILGACGAVVVIFGTMIYAAVVWSRHGLFPSEHLRKGSRLRRFNEKRNQEMGWGDGVDDQPADDEPEPPLLRGDASADVRKYWPS